MTHVTITPSTAILCNIAFDYDESTKEQVKALAGANYQAGQWIVPILHLPTLKLIFSTMTEGAGSGDSLPRTAQADAVRLRRQ